MKIFFTGSIDGHRPFTGQAPTPKDALWRSAATELGGEVARRGHTALLRNAGSMNVVDHYVLGGIARHCAGGSPARVELHLPETFPLIADCGAPGLEVQVFRYPGHGALGSRQCPETYLEFLAATVRAVDLCDVVITLGDGESVRMAGSLASCGKAPIVAVEAFGGSSAEIYRENRNLYAALLPDSPLRASLVRPWREAQSAADIISLAEQVTSMASESQHTYFVSYSHEDEAAADYVELELRRRGRSVHRDVASIGPGDDLPDTLAALIADCDTFIAIGSMSYINSVWCGRELLFAADHARVPRVVYLHIDASRPPITVAGKLICEASSRAEQRAAIEKLIYLETDVRRRLTRRCT